MKKRALWSCFVAVLAFGLVACDSDSDNEEPLTDAEKFIGTWTVQTVVDDSGDQTNRFFESTNSVTLQFATNSLYSLVADAKSDSLDQTIEGGYTVSEGSRAVTLAASILGQDVDLVATYAFLNDNTVELRTDSFVLNAVLQPEEPLVGVVVLTVTRST